MSLYICRQCASAHALRRGALKGLASKFSPESKPMLSFLSEALIRPRPVVGGTRFLSSSSPGRSVSELNPPKKPSSIPRHNNTQTPHGTKPQSPKPHPAPATLSSKTDLPSNINRITHIKLTRRRIDQLVKRLETDALYLEFWKICCTESVMDQREIWRNSRTITNAEINNLQDQNLDRHDMRQESLYRAFNSAARPKHSSYPQNRKYQPHSQDGKWIPPSRVTVRYGRLPELQGSVSSSPENYRLARDEATLTSPTRSLRTSTSGADAESVVAPMLHTLTFIDQSHPRRLLQMHQYFDQVLRLRIGYYPRIALLVAFSSQGDMATVHKLFSFWQKKPPLSKQQLQQQHTHQIKGAMEVHSDLSQATHSQDRQYDHGTGGKEMYSAVIRGLVGRNFQDSTLRPHYVSKDPLTGIRSHGVTQIYAALELFYELLRKGGNPTFETYHSLIVGLATFKNDMEAAELLLDHMIMRKRKPYVQVLHVMCREYTRRRDFPAAERIFGMLREYGIKPRALTCNLMLKAVFQLSTVDALLYLGPSANITNSDGDNSDSEDLDGKARRLKRQKIQQLREYMRDNGAAPDEITFSTLLYGFGHMEDGYPDLRATMVEMTTSQRGQGASEHGGIEPNLVILNSLLFALLNHGKVKTAESILDQMLRSTHPVPKAAVTGTGKHWQEMQQVASPFRKQQEGDDKELVSNAGAGVAERFEEELGRSQELHVDLSPPRFVMIPGRGTFHALMLAYVERGDIVGMERVLDKMIQARELQEQQLQHQRRLKPHSRLGKSAVRAGFGPLQGVPAPIDLEADEYTANIMLLGYLIQRDIDKVDRIVRQIQARKDWSSKSMFEGREVQRERLITFVRQQSSKAVVERSLHGNEGEGESRSRLRSGKSSTSSARTIEGSGGAGSTVDPLSGNLVGELDDDIEIDVTTLSAKLRGLMKTSSS